MIIKIIIVVLSGFLGSIIKSYDYANRSTSVAFHAPIYRKKINFLILPLWVVLLITSIVLLFFLNIYIGFIGLIFYLVIIPRIIDPIFFKYVTGMSEEEHAKKYGYEFDKKKY